jgi:hypothetical protein
MLGVFDALTTKPVDSAEVIDLLSGNRTRTTFSGTVSLSWLSSQSDSAAIQIRKVGYEEQRLLVMTRDTASITVVLQRATTLASVLVTDSAPGLVSRMMVEFEERRVRGTGRFITPQQIRTFEARGLVRLRDAMTAGGIVARNYGGRVCPTGPLYFVDGMLNRNRERLPSDQTSQYEAIEFYAGTAQAPAKFSIPGSHCGVVVLWTRK